MNGVKIKKEEEVQAVMTGREIIQDFMQSNKPTSHVQYQKMCASLDSFDKWNDQLRIDFLNEFLDQYEILDERFNQLVQQLCKLKWNNVPSILRHEFVKFLSFLAIYHVHHIGTIFQSFVAHFLPINLQKGDDEHLQEELYKMAHEAIQMVISYNQLSSRVLLKCCIKQFPHIRQPAPTLLAYLRNLIQLAESSKDEEVAMEIWSLIIDRLLQLDTSITELQNEESKLSFCHNDNGASNSNHLDESELEDTENPMEAKIDQLIAIILHYLHQKCGEGMSSILASNEITNEANFKAISAMANSNRQEGQGHLLLFKLLIEAFDEHILSVVGVHCTPFIWFYLCSLSKENCSLMLEFLWEVLRAPVSSPSELKKAQNAAAFLCGFLARANYVDFEFCCSWIRRIIAWCLEYVENCEAAEMNGKKTFGRNQHGTFYATIQALLFVFCYRHDELHSLDALDRAQFSKLDQLIYNCLHPLHNISQGVALCFLNLNKRLNLIKNCKGNSSNQPMRQTGPSMVKRRKTIVDLYFPFSFCSLTICTPYIFPLMRRFSSIFATSSKFTSNEDSELTIDDDMESGMEMSNGNKNDEDETGNSCGMAVDEGYEDELMCVQSVTNFSKYFMNVNAVEYDEDEDEQNMED